MKVTSLSSLMRRGSGKGGARNAFRKYMRNLKITRLLGNYLDAMGILDGLYAYKGPNYAQIDLTNNCNNDCIGCWCNSPLLGEKKMPLKVKEQTIPFRMVRSLIDELYRMGSRHIYYAGGGEPFMHPEIMEILQYTKEKGLACSVNTNFTLIDEKRAGKIADLGVDALTVSVWAGTASVYAAVHPNKDERTFYQIKDTLRLLNRLKHGYPEIKIYNVIFNLNYQDIEAMLDFALGTESEAIEFTVIDTIPEKTDKLLLSGTQRRALLESCRRVQARYDNGLKNKIRLLGIERFMRRIGNIDAESAEYDSDIIGTLPCYAGWAFTRILADGNVNSCLKSHRFPVGNILTQDFRDAWNSPAQRYFREKTVGFKKDEPFFSLIGNDPDARMGCFKSCDNIGHNMDMLERISSLKPLEKAFLKGMVNILKFIRSFDSFNHGHRLS